MSSLHFAIKESDWLLPQSQRHANRQSLASITLWIAQNLIITKKQQKNGNGKTEEWKKPLNKVFFFFFALMKLFFQTLGLANGGGEEIYPSSTK